MLILTRHIGEEIKLDGDITIRVCEIDGQRVRLGITAPRAVNVWRSELGPDGRRKYAVEGPKDA